MRKVLILGLLLITLGCEEQLPTAQSFPVLQTLYPDVTETGADFKLRVIQPGSEPVAEYGFVWDTDDPTLDSRYSITLSGNPSMGVHNINISKHLFPGLTYHVRAYATDGNTTVYGDMETFESLGAAENIWTFQALENAPTFEFNSTYATGFNGKGYFLFQNGRFFEYSPEVQTFSEGPAFPDVGTGRDFFTFVPVNDVLYVFSSAEEYLFKYENNAWTRLSRIPNGSFRSTANYYQGLYWEGSIYFFSARQSVRYELATGLWQSQPRLSQTRSSLGGAVLGNKVYLMIDTGSIWVYDLDTKRWLFETEFPGLVEDRIIFFNHEDRMYVGLTDQGNLVNPRIANLWSYDPLSKAWEKRTPHPTFMRNGRLAYFYQDGKVHIADPTLANGIWTYDAASDF